MYLPPHFHQRDIELVKKVCLENSFITCLSMDTDGLPFSSHIPVTFDFSKDQWVVSGHLSIHNPQWRHWQSKPWGQVIVGGPHTYISPLFYKSGRDVPTWNYISVHMTGKIALKPKAHDILRDLAQLTKKFEQDSAYSDGESWKFSLPDDLKSNEQIESAIIGFDLVVDKVEPKFKLSQNRPAIDQVGIKEGLTKRGDEQSKAIVQWMDLVRPK